jgi:hypothetical protein
VVPFFFNEVKTGALSGTAGSTGRGPSTEENTAYATSKDADSGRLHIRMPLEEGLPFWLHVIVLSTHGSDTASEHNELCD